MNNQEDIDQNNYNISQYQYIQPQNYQADFEQNNQQQIYNDTDFDEEQQEEQQVNNNRICNVELKSKIENNTYLISKDSLCQNDPNKIIIGPGGGRIIYDSEANEYVEIIEVPTQGMNQNNGKEEELNKQEEIKDSQIQGTYQIQQNQSALTQPIQYQIPSNQMLIQSADNIYQPKFGETFIQSPRTSNQTQLRNSQVPSDQSIPMMSDDTTRISGVTGINSFNPNFPERVIKTPVTITIARTSSGSVLDVNNSQSNQQEYPKPMDPDKRYYNIKNSVNKSDSKEYDYYSQFNKKDSAQAKTNDFGERDDNQILNELLKKNRAIDDPNFDFDGWKKFYPENDAFFNYNYGYTIPKQTVVINPDNIDMCEFYQGEINKEGERHGFGILITSKFIKRGDFRNGEFCGWGREAKKHGVSIEAKFEGGKANGKGTYKNGKGNVYVGDFSGGKRCGYGNLETNKFYYEGQFFNDKLNGKGKITFKGVNHEYEGTFKDNEIDGRGIFRWENGDVYEGDMVKGKMEGIGKYYYSNGQIYEGEYKAGAKHGKGRLIYPNGKIFEGIFNNGEPVGKGTYIESGYTNQI